MNKKINGKRDGYWEWHYNDENLLSKGHYKDGKKYGYWEGYYFQNKFQNKLCYKGNYKDGKEIGYWERFNRYGVPSYQVFFF